MMSTETTRVEAIERLRDAERAAEAAAENARAAITRLEQTSAPAAEVERAAAELLSKLESDVDLAFASYRMKRRLGDAYPDLGRPLSDEEFAEQFGALPTDGEG